MKGDRKRDRRTRYTIKAIKDAFLSLEKEMAYDEISVKKLCERAEISRATFYLHYDELGEVLDEVLDDALLFSEESNENTLDLIDVIQSDKIPDVRENEAVLPACQRIADSHKYHDLFIDASLGEYIIMRISNHEHDRVIPDLMGRTGLSEEYAELLFRFMLHGSFYVNKLLKWEKNDTWYDFQKLLSAFLDAGINEVSKKRE
ncbi:MAG: TetR/AcrR family transcriptional regulator [Lachnospiraceae bacterium]|nr:TetR/AcrR family transcriptional regulator [Lachnospiraceae bacterium]